jgi:hypothetical protein
VQPSQDNCDDMVKKLEKGSNVTIPQILSKVKSRKEIFM